MGMIEQGAKHVYVLDMSPEPSGDFKDCAALAEKFGGRLSYHQVDVTDPKQVDAVFKKLEKEEGRLDAVFAAAGILGEHLLPRYRAVRDWGADAYTRLFRHP